MSKIFEALRKAGGEVAFPPIGEEQIAQTGSAHAAEPPDRAAPEAAPLAAPVFSESPGAKPPVPPAGLGGHIRTLPIRVPADSPLLPFDGSHRHAAERYRIIRTKIVQHPDQPRMLVVSSAGAGDGKTVSAINIAGVLALKNDANVLLVDADFRRSNVANFLALPAEPNVTDLLAGGCALEDVIVRVQQFPNLYVIPGGKRHGDGMRSNPAELLDSPRWRDICAVLRREFRFTILDAPPIGAVADYDLIRAVCDGVIVVVRPDHTNRALCLQALKAVPKAKMIGVLMNCTEEWFLRKTHGYYYYSEEARP